MKTTDHGRESARAQKTMHDLQAMEIAPDFAARLARRNGWTAGRAERAIGEYRRFLLLSTMGPVVPSRDVDAAWHEHILHTRHYQERLPAILGRTLHHEPGSADGSDEDAHGVGYLATLSAYRRTFGEEAPTDVWPRCACAADGKPSTEAARDVVLASPLWVVVAALAVAALVLLSFPANICAAAIIVLVAGFVAAMAAESRAIDQVHAPRRRPAGPRGGYGRGGGGTGGARRTSDDDGFPLAAFIAADAGESPTSAHHGSHGGHSSHGDGGHSSHGGHISCGGHSSCGGNSSCGGSSCGGGGGD